MRGIQGYNIPQLVPAHSVHISCSSMEWLSLIWYISIASHMRLKAFDGNLDAVEFVRFSHLIFLGDVMGDDNRSEGIAAMAIMGSIFKILLAT
jgi:hypothetical protein